VLDGDYSNAGDGSDCCSADFDPTTDLCGCVSSGDPSQTSDGSDCCSGTLDSSGYYCS